MKAPETAINQSRKNILFLLLLLWLVLVIIRLFYWQILKGQQLKEEG